MSRLRALAALCGVLLVATGCGSAQTASVRDVAARFYAAVADGDGAGGCALLAPKTVSTLEQSEQEPCAQALPSQDVPTVDRPTAVHVYGTMAQVRYADETAFLARFGDAWKVMAAGCRPDGADRPYQCQLEGG